MASRRFARIDRLKAIERELLVVRHSIDRLEKALADGRADLPDGTSVRDLNAAHRQLEATFLIRLWAEFETVVRSYYGWLTNNRESRIRALDLIDALNASRRGRSTDDSARLEVHEVRRYRNSLVHDRDDSVPAVALSEFRRRLNRYLGSKLPEQWG